ncbi:hypothetical protein BDQ17DRAFT_1393667 [Cyathus striatus]|nr:hypothetical protein BDQ17DRAFT_1393667 [Cyathus striatus]
MPGPGSRHKKGAKSTKPKAARASASDKPSAYDAYVGDISEAADWHLVVTILCEAYDLPDLSTRGGLKKVHSNFDAIYRRIEDAYSKYDNEKLRAGIVGIYAKMSVDSLLRNKLFERGLLDKIMPLLNSHSCRYLALRSLVTVTHHGGAHIRIEIAKKASLILTKLIEDNLDDDHICQLAVATLSHSVATVAEGAERPADPVTLKTLDVAHILHAVMHSIQRPTSTSYAIEHALELCKYITLHCASAYKSCPDATRFLIAGLRSKDWVFRCQSMGALIHLHHKEAEDDQRQLDPHKFFAAIQSGFPDHLTDVIMDYGMGRSETFITLTTARDFQDAMFQVVKDHDLHGLGLKLAQFILRTEFSITDGTFQTEDPHTGKLSTMDLGLPFRMWSDALPHCARAIREQKNPAEIDVADILDIKYAIMKRRISHAVELAKTGLRACKKGMKCKFTSPFVRFQLMQRAVEHAADMGVTVLQESPRTGQKRWEEGIAFLMSAMEDAKTYIDQAPPDNRHMKNMLYWYIILTITMREGEISSDLHDLSDAFGKLKIADEYSRFIGVPPPQTCLRLTKETVVKLFREAIEQFSETISRTTTRYKAHEVSPDKLQDDLAAWLEDLHLDGESEPEPSCINPTVNMNHVALYRCSYCGNPSAALRKCSGCEKSRYCDAGCQKSHWTDHKKTCKT